MVAQVLMPGNLRFSVIPCQRHSVTVIRSNRAMNIGARIRKRRKERGMRVEDLAKAAGIAATTLYDLERGESRSTTKLHHIAAALRCRLEWLETGRGSVDDIAGVADARPVLYDMSISPEGVRVGREWEKLREPLRGQIQLLIETLVADQVRDGRKKRAASIEATA